MLRTCSTRSAVRCVLRRAGLDCRVCSSTTPLFDALPRTQQQLLERYIELLLDTTKHTNLVSAASATRDVLLTRHVEDSLTLLPAIENSARQAGRLRLVDLGSGAGFPGIVLSIARPQWSVLLLDAARKKASFLTGVVHSLSLANAAVLCARAEDAAQRPDLREQCDVVVARAVAEMRVLAELALPLLRKGGILVAAKQSLGLTIELENSRAAVRMCGGGDFLILPTATVSSSGTPFAAVVVTKT